MSSYSDVIESTNDQVCDSVGIDEHKVSLVRQQIGDDEDLNNLAELFKALADATRVRILRALSIDELCVCDIAELVGLSQSAISHQLRYLRISRLVKYRKEGKKAYYSLDDDHVRHLMNEGLKHVKEDR